MAKIFHKKLDYKSFSSNISKKTGQYLSNLPVLGKGASKVFKDQKKFTRIIFILAIISIIAAIYFFFKFTELKNNPASSIDKQTKDLVARVSKLIVLPKDETPTIATVNDPMELKDQPFFANAKKGDKVLIYTNAKKAILYDPVENKVVDIAPINIGKSP